MSGTSVDSIDSVLINFDNNNFEKDPNQLLEKLNLNNNYFSIRGELIYVNTQKKEVIIKICSSLHSKKLKNASFKLIIQGEISIKFLNNFVSLDVIRDDNTLKLVNYEVIDKLTSKNP